MKRHVSLIIIVALTVMFLKSIPLEASSREVAKVNDAIEVLEEIMAIPEKVFHLPYCLMLKASQ